MAQNIPSVLERRANALHARLASLAKKAAALVQAFGGAPVPVKQLNDMDFK